MKIQEIYEFLNELSPFELQEKWDNSGLVVGSMEDEFERVYISMDLDLETVEKAHENSLFITHHPLIFSPLRTVNFDSYSTKILRRLIQKNIAVISLHTNIDKTHLNAYVAKDILGLDVIDGEEYILYANANCTFDELKSSVSKRLGLEYVKSVRCHEKVLKVALVTGSGMSMISQVQADVFLTGDIKYHDAMEAKARGISLIDIRHYESEHHFSNLMMGLLEKYLKKNELKAIISASKNPFEFC